MKKSHSRITKKHILLALLINLVFILYLLREDHLSLLENFWYMVLLTIAITSSGILIAAYIEQLKLMKKIFK